jgi:pimeloyl-ACP methyl ester carboxylesterase
MHFLWGEEDPFGDATVAHRFLEYLPNAGLELVREAGHAPWIDDPAGAATTTRTFLTG